MRSQIELYICLQIKDLILSGRRNCTKIHSQKMQALCKNLPDKVRLKRFKGCLGISALMQTDVAPPCIQCNLKFGKSSEKFPSSMIYQGQLFSLLTNFVSRPVTLHFVLIFLKHCLKDFIKPICRNAWCVKPDDCMSKSIRNRQIPLPPLTRHLEIIF